MPGAVCTAGVALSSFNPKDLTGLIGDWNADLGVTISTGVDQVLDQSGAGNHVSQPTGAQQPSIQSGWRKGHKLIQHSASPAKSLGRSSFTGGVITGPCTFFWIGDLTNGDVEIKGLVDAWVGTNRRFIANNLVSNAISMWGGSYVNLSRTTSESGPTCIVAVFNGATASLRYIIDGATLKSTTGNVGANTFDSIRLGAAVGGAIPPVGGGWSRFCLYNRDLSLAEILHLESYAKSDYSIDSGVPKLFSINENSTVTQSGANLTTLVDTQGHTWSVSGTIPRTGVTRNGIQCVGSFTTSQFLYKTADIAATAVPRVAHFVVDLTTTAAASLLDTLASPRVIYGAGTVQHYTTAAGWGGTVAGTTGLQVLTFEELASTTNIYVNGTLVSSVSHAISALLGGASMRMMQGLNGVFCEASIHLDTTGWRDAEVARLKNKWGI